MAVGEAGERRPQPGHREVVHGELIQRRVGGAGEQFADGAQVVGVRLGRVWAVLARPAGDEERVHRRPQRQDRGFVGHVVMPRGGHRTRLSRPAAMVGEGAPPSGG
jgi:hypothetical protein